MGSGSVLSTKKKNSPHNLQGLDKVTEGLGNIKQYNHRIFQPRKMPTKLNQNLSHNKNRTLLSLDISPDTALSCKILLLLQGVFLLHWKKKYNFGKSIHYFLSFCYYKDETFAIIKMAPHSWSPKTTLTECWTIAVSDNMQSGMMSVNPRHEKTFKSSLNQNTTTNI